MIKTIMASLILMNLVTLKSTVNMNIQYLLIIFFSLWTFAGYIMNRLGQSLNVDQVKVYLFFSSQVIFNVVFKGNDQLRRPEQGRENIIRGISEAND